MDRPKCQWGGIGGCERPATWMVGIAHDYRFRLSCKDHRDDWNKHGDLFCWLGELKGYLEDRTIEEVLHDNQVRAKARKATASSKSK